MTALTRKPYVARLTRADGKSVERGINLDPHDTEASRYAVAALRGLLHAAKMTNSVLTLEERRS